MGNTAAEHLHAVAVADGALVAAEAGRVALLDGAPQREEVVAERGCIQHMLQHVVLPVQPQLALDLDVAAPEHPVLAAVHLPHRPLALRHLLERREPLPLERHVVRRVRHIPYLVVCFLADLPHLCEVREALLPSLTHVAVWGNLSPTRCLPDCTVVP